MDEQELEQQQSDSIPEGWLTAVPGPDGKRRFELHIYRMSGYQKAKILRFSSVTLSGS